MNTSKFVYQGVELALDVDDLTVDQRIESALTHFKEKTTNIDGEDVRGSKIRLVVEAARETLNEIFAREDAADLLLGKLSRLSEVMETFQRIALIIGEMRGLAIAQAHGAMLAVSEGIKASASQTKKDKKK